MGCPGGGAQKQLDLLDLKLGEKPGLGMKLVSKGTGGGMVLEASECTVLPGKQQEEGQEGCTY